MFKTAIMVGVAVLVGAVPATAQQRGTLEFGAFGSNTSWDNSSNMNGSWGAGGRVGIFIIPRLSAEFEGGGGTATRSLGLASVNFGVLSGRLTAVPFKFGAVSILLGAGVDHTDTFFFESYGFHGLLGAKVRLSNNVALRVDGIRSWMANGNGKHTGLHLGLSVYRHPHSNTVTNTVMVDGPVMVQRPDSVSAYETRRLRGVALSYDALRDSLSKGRYANLPPLVIRDTLVLEGINFDYDSSALTPESFWILDRVARALQEPEWAAARFEIAGHTSSIGTHEYNMDLSQRRAESVRAYLVSRGVANNRLTPKGYGEVNPLYPNSNEGRNWRNRRVELRRIKP
jgi:outer membrane protein OmpA-like peptidoglycan-associated protein